MNRLTRNKAAWFILFQEAQLSKFRHGFNNQEANDEANVERTMERTMGASSPELACANSGIIRVEREFMRLHPHRSLHVRSIVHPMHGPDN